MSLPDTHPEAEPYAEALDGVEAAPAPVGVYAVRPVPVEETPTRAWTAVQTAIPVGVGLQIAPAHLARRRLLVHNAGTVTLWLAPNQPGATPTMGYPLAAGAEHELRTRHEVWAAVDPAAAGPGLAATLSEFLDG